MSDPDPLPPNHSPPSTADAVNLTVSLCLTYTLCIAALRIWIRKAAYGIDDYLVALTTVVTVGHSATTYIALANGLGMTWMRLLDGSRANLETLDAVSLAGIVTWIVAVYLSKCVVLVFLIRLTKTPWNLKLYYVLLCCVASLGIVSALLATVDCQTNSGYIWAFLENDRCPTQQVRWKTITGLDVVTEILLLALPVQLVWGLQMPKARKAIIITAFYIRLPVIGFTLGRSHYTTHLSSPTRDPGSNSAIVVIWMEIQLAYSLAASTLSALKAFAENFDSGFGLGVFARDRRNDTYVLSDVSKDSANSTAAEKSAARGQAAESQRTDGKDLEISRMEDTAPGFPPLKLRPGAEGRTTTQVSAQPMDPMDVSNLWREESSLRSQGSSSNADDMVILRRTDYSVSNDRAPMLER